MVLTKHWAKKTPRKMDIKYYNFCKVKSTYALMAMLACSCAQSTAHEVVTFKALLDQANQNYPTLLAARLDTRASQEELEAARRLRWPTVSANVESASTNPAVTFPNRSLIVEQILWDAGSVKSKIAESKSSSEVQINKALLVQEEVYLQMASAWQNLYASQQRMQVAQQAILTLQAYQQQMQRRVRAEVSPRIELELANSRILQMQVDLTAAEQSLKQALTRIEQYTGRNDLLPLTRRKDAFSFVAPTTGFEQMLASTDWQAVTDQHPSIAKAKAESEQQKSKMEQKRAEAWPQVYARVSQPVFGVPQGRPTDPIASVGFKYTSAPGFSNQLQAKALATRIASAQELVTAAQINLQQTLRVDQDEYLNAKSKVEVLELAVKGSESVLESYQRQFEGAKKTWQDLLNAVRELVQNQFALADARAAQLGAMQRLQIRTGQAIQ